MAEFTILDRNGDPLRYQDKVITFPSRARAHAFCGLACTVVANAAEEGSGDQISDEQVSSLYPDRYLEGLIATLCRASKETPAEAGAS